MRRAALALLVALALLAGVLLVRAAGFRSRQLAVEPAAAAAVDADGVAERLAAAIRLRTVSHQDRSLLDGAEFARFHALLERSYPATHAALARERVAEWSLLYTWRGRDPALPALLLMAHHDVVPVEPGTEERWQYPPFAGRVEGGFVWGRGALDDKASVICILEAVERLVARGYAPERSLLLAFGHDEEVGGDDGALQIAERLKSRGTEVAFGLDEGGAVTSGMLAFAPAPIALIGIAEKGSVTIGLDVEVAGGHSSMPPRHTAVGILSRAVQRLEDHPMPARLDGATRALLEHLGPELPFGYRIVLANLWLFGRGVEALMSQRPTTDAMLRTTTAATIFEAGIKENVLPARAHAAMNFRIRPGDRIEDVAEHVRRVVDDERISLQVGLRSVPRDPTDAAPIDAWGFEQVQRALRQTFPGVIAVPNLVVGGTDARHYAALTPNLYRVLPLRLEPEDLSRLHGTDERVAVDQLADAVRFYERLIRSSTGTGSGQQ